MFMDHAPSFTGILSNPHQGCLKTKITQSKRLDPNSLTQISAICYICNYRDNTAYQAVLHYVGIFVLTFLGFSRKIVELAGFILRMELLLIEGKLAIRLNMDRA